MNIDWDEVADDADNTPRSLLAEVIGIADDIEDLVILVKDKDGCQREWWCAGESTRLIMLELAKFSLLKEIGTR